MVTSVVITRRRHPLQGRSLAVLGQMRRHGRLELLLVLPDGSKSLVPSAWTDLGEQNPIANAAAGPATAATLGSLQDLLHASAALAALSTRGRTGQGQAARQSPCKEDSRAACAAEVCCRTRFRRHPRIFSPSFPHRRSARRSRCSPT